MILPFQRETIDMYAKIAVAIATGLYLSCAGAEAVQQTAEHKTPAETIGPVNWTPLLLRPDRITQVFQGSDGKFNVAYEIVLTNYSHNPTDIKKIEVVDSDEPNTVLLTLTDKSLESCLLPFASKGGTTLAGGENGILFVNIARDTNKFPASLSHRVTVGSKDPTNQPTTLTYTCAPMSLDQSTPVTIGPPLRGGPWVVLGGYSGGGSVGHRRAIFPIDNHTINAQRYAIDWIMIDKTNRSSYGPMGKNESGICYGQPVLAVADGTVAGTIDRYQNQTPGTPTGEERVSYPGGNSVVLNIGNGNYAFYAHLKPGSVLVKPGDTVKRGQKLAEVGNTGNTTGPHLHMHILTGPSMLSAPGVPYLFDQFEVTGEVADIDKVDEDDLKHLPQAVIESKDKGIHKHELPKEATVLKFPE
jgi:Peptidase family M23